jgi:hypothetical protein
MSEEQRCCELAPKGAPNRALINKEFQEELIQGWNHNHEIQKVYNEMNEAMYLCPRDETIYYKLGDTEYSTLEELNAALSALADSETRVAIESASEAEELKSDD